MKPSHAYHKIAVSKDEWHKKEDTGKSLRMPCVHCGMPKDTCCSETMSNSYKIKPVALAIVK